MKNFRDQSRNPLGIVALFISLIYGFASLLLGTSADKLETGEKWPILIFIVIFPFVVLYVFYQLVTKHHGKLYSPSDYQTDDSFLRTLSKEEKEQKLEYEAIEAIEAIEALEALEAQKYLEDFEDELAAEHIDTADAGRPYADHQEGKTLGQEKTSKNVDLIAYTKETIREIETLIIKNLEREFNQKPRIGIKIGHSNNRFSTFDAAFVIPNEHATFIDIKYFTVLMVFNKIIEEFVNRAKFAVNFLNIKSDFILILVFDGEFQNKFKVPKEWDEIIENSKLNIEIRTVNGYFGDTVPVISGHIVPLSMGDFTC